MEFVGLLSELILSSKETDKLLKYAESMSSYKSACQEDTELQSFDSSLQQRTIKLISSLAGRVGRTGFLSLDSLIEVCGFLVGLSQDVGKIIIASKEDVSKNEELKSLVDLYTKSTNKTLDLFKTVERCVGKADIILLHIRVAIKKFETESLDTDFGGNKKNKYAETLEKLNKVKAMEDPFGDGFVKQCEAVYAEQLEILDKIRELQVIFEKKHKNVKKWRRLGNIFCGVLVFSAIALLICSPVISLPVVATVAIGTTAVAIFAANGMWLNSTLKDSEKALETRSDLSQLMENSTTINIDAMATIKDLVEMLITRISFTLETVEFAVECAVEMREEESLKIVMQEIIRKVDGFAEKIEQVGKPVAEGIKVVASGRFLVLEHSQFSFIERECDMIQGSNHEVGDDSSAMELPQGPVTRAKAKELTQAVQRMLKEAQDEGSAKAKRIVTYMQAEEQDQGND